MSNLGVGNRVARTFGWPTALNNRRMPFLVETTLHQVFDGLCLFSRFFLVVETTFDYIMGEGGGGGAARLTAELAGGSPVGANPSVAP